MPQHAKNPEHRWYFYPVEPPETVLSWETWQTYSVCIPGPLIPYLLNVMRVYQWEGRVKSEYEDERKAFVEAWNDLIARVGAAVECETMPYPIFRQNPLNGCQMQQSLDNGETWVTVMDASACSVPADPAPPMIRLRQSPTQPKLLEQSLNSGSSWTTAYDFSLYTIGRNVIQEQILYNQTTNILNEYNQTWNNSPTVNNFAPSLVFNGTSDDAHRDAAICYAVGIWYDAAKTSAIELKRSGGDSQAAFAAGIAGAAAGMIGSPVFGVIVAAVVGALVKGIETLFTNISDGNWASARNDIICCMYEGLMGETLTEARFQAGVSACGFDTGSVSEAIRELIHLLLQERDVYLSFIRFASEGFQFAQYGILPDCLCDDEEPGTWEKTFDLLGGANGWTVNVGAYVGGTGIQSTGGGAYPYTVDISRVITWGDAQLTRVRVGSTSTTADSESFRGLYYPGTVYPVQVGYTGSTGNYEMDFMPNNPQPPTLTAQVSNVHVPGTNTIRYITLNGTGTEPTW